MVLILLNIPTMVIILLNIPTMVLTLLNIIRSIEYLVIAVYQSPTYI